MFVPIHPSLARCLEVGVFSGIDDKGFVHCHGGVGRLPISIPIVSHVTKDRVLLPNGIDSVVMGTVPLHLLIHRFKWFPFRDMFDDFQRYCSSWMGSFVFVLNRMITCVAC